MKIAYIGIDLMLTILEKLLDYGCEVLEIFTCKTDNFTEFNTGIIDFAKKHNIRFTDERITVSDFERLKNNGCEAVFCAGYYHKITIFRDIPTVNVHPSLLPHGKGSWPMPYYILEGLPYGGMSIHKAEEGFDEGDILVQRKFPLSAQDNLESYMSKAIESIDDDLRRLSCDFLTYYNNAKPQNGPGCYLKAPDKDMFTVNANTSVDEADRIFRAFYGYECYYNDNGREYLLIKSKALNDAKYSKIDGCLSFKLKDGFAVCKKENVYDVEQ